MEWLNIDIGLLACLSAFMSVTLATLVMIDFIGYVSVRYKERYLQEAATELDDVLLQIPANRIFDVSLAASAFSCFMAVAIMGAGTTSWSWSKGIAIGLFAALIAFPLPRLYLRFLKKQRLKKFNDQLEDGLSSISSSLKAGFSINQALETVANENRHPISIEFRLLVQELRLGVPLEEALEKMVHRLGSPDLELVATAIITARQTGGELTTILDRLAEVIRERIRINNKLMAMTAQGRLQAYIIGAMPLLLLGVLSYITPGMMNNFFHSLIGIILLGLSFILVGIGFFVIKKILAIDV